ncbi:MAG: lactate utilization protein C [Neisseria sp.]|nr:lactate utilization protein C [Neisseria sp.]
MSARENILAKLKKADAYPMMEPRVDEYYREVPRGWDSEAARLRHWAKTMRAVKTEVYWVRRDGWPQMMLDVARRKGLKNILLPLRTEHGRAAARVFQEAADIEIKAFSRPIEEWKDEYFADVDAGFTSARCAIAETGTLVLWPDADEPRSLSLVPPVHFCLLDVSDMYDTFYDALNGEDMAAGMPTNVVLVSGPSKTADIQLTLAYGAHGPRDLAVLAVLPDHLSPADLEDAA